MEWCDDAWSFEEERNRASAKRAYEGDGHFDPMSGRYHPTKSARKAEEDAEKHAKRT